MSHKKGEEMGQIYDITNERFARYGRILEGLPVEELIRVAGS